MYEGYLEFSGTEIVNAERTEAYVAGLGIGLGLRSLFRTDKLHLANEEKAYESPLIDDAPWAADSDSATSDFFGLYPLEMEGFDGSTMASSVTEHLDDGGSHGTQRDTSRAMRVHGLLVASSREGAEAGLSWLSEAVRTSDCALDTSCGGGDIRYYLTEPDVCEFAFTETEQANPDRENFGDVPAPELLTYRWPRELINTAMPARVRWSGSGAEGTVFRYGALARTTSEVLYDSGPIATLRRNYALNPGMASSLNGYSFTGAGIMVWTQASDTDPARATITPSAADGADLLGVLAAPSISLKPDTYTVSLAARGDDGTSATMSVSTPAGQLNAATLLLTSGFQRFSTTITVPAESAISIQVSGSGAMEVTQVLVERTTDALPYFDGDTADYDEYTAYWTGEIGNSISEKIWTGEAEFTWDDSNFRPFLRVTSGVLTNVQLAWWKRDEISMLTQLDTYERTLHEVQCTQGPQVLGRYFNTGVGYFIEVDVVFVSGNPHPFSPGLGLSTFPLTNQPYEDPDDDAAVDDQAWLQDPNQLAVTLPVRAPVILDQTLRSFTKWQRYYVSIPASAVQAWGQSVPTIGINSKNAPIKQVRMRFHANPFSYDPTTVDPTSYCGEVVLSYLPATTRIVIDGITRSAVASKGGKPTIPADHLLYGADGAPVGWPELSCGIPYVLTIDIPAGTAIDAFDVDLVIRRRG